MKIGATYIDTYGVIWKVIRFHRVSWHKYIPVLWNEHTGEGNWFNGTGLTLLSK